MLKAIVVFLFTFQAFAQWGDYNEEWKLLESKAQSDESAEIIPAEFQAEIADLDTLIADKVETTAAAPSRKRKAGLDQINLNDMEKLKKKKLMKRSR